MDKDILRLQIEVAEKARKDVEVAISPQLKHLRMNYEASIKYAEQAIKSGFVLNGGALVLFSGYAAIFKLRPEGVVVQIAMIVLAFAIGLVLASMCAFYAYHGARFAMHIANHRIAATILGPYAKKDAESAEEHPDIKKQRDAVAYYGDKEKRSLRKAVIAGALSLLMFVIGAFGAGWTLMSHAGSVP
jgi:cobalamin biosynthesis protein CobD/CbiB